MTFPTQNADEDLVSKEAPFIGNFHKTLPHNDFGEVIPSAYRKFERTCLEIEAGSPINFENVPTGPLTTAEAPAQAPFESGIDASLTKSVAKYTSPMAGASTETLGPDPKTLEMPPAPGCRSISATAEMVELYWMALLRDAPLLAFQDSHGTPDGTCADIGAHNAELGYNVMAASDTPERVDLRPWAARIF